MVKEFLSRAGQSFTVRLIDEDEKAYDDLLALGYRTVPVTVIGDTAIKGFDPEALTKALEAAD
jgi:glutaredoxin